MTTAKKTKKTSWLGQVLSFPIISVLAGVIAISNTITYGALVFSDALNEYLYQGIGMALFSGFVLALIAAIFGSGRGMVAFPQSAIAPILALMAANIMLDLPASATPNEQFLTIVAGLGFSAFFTGLVFLTFGRLRLGKAFRFMPYPVFGGFLAGLGWLLLKGGITFLAEMPLQNELLNQLNDPYFLAHFLPGIVVGIIIFVAQRRFKNPILVPLILVIGVGVFYLSAYWQQISLTVLAEEKWLLGPFPKGLMWVPFDLKEVYYTAHWDVVFKQSLTLATITFTALIGILFNSSGIELETKQVVSLDQELQASGVANIIASLGGGLVGYPSTSISTLPYRMGQIRSRWTGIVIAGYFGLTLFYGGTLLSYIPKWAVGSMLVYLGLSFLYSWVFLGWKSLPKSDYLVMLMIFAIISVFGFLEGVLAGIIATAILFAINYSRTSVIRNSFSRANYKSNVERSHHEEAFLQEKGDMFYILKLQGFIFFGTAYNLIAQLIERFGDKDCPDLRFLIMDFRLVNGMDSSAINSFIRMKHFAENKHIYLTITNLAPAIEKQLISDGFLIADEEAVLVFPDIDRALEWCEEKLLEEEGVTINMAPKLKHQLQDRIPTTVDIGDLFEYLERRAYAAKDYIIHADDAPTGIYFIESGEISVQLPLKNNENIRLKTIGAGSVIGEMGVYMNTLASAEVIANTESIVYFLSKETLNQLEVDAPQIAAFCHKYLATILSQRLSAANSTLRAFSD